MEKIAKMMAQDQFEKYYKEKLWESIPSIYRHEDGLAENPGVLEAIIQVIAKQAAILRRSQDQLWDDQFIERCDEWAVPYIGDLVATRMLSALNEVGRRTDVAKTIYYRRRKGTPRILEELIYDVSRWSGKMTEQFKKLVRARHGLDPFPATLRERYSGTLPGGIADLRNQRVAELTNGPFEEYFHAPDMRRHRGLNGRYNITKLAFYLYRLKVYDALNVTPFRDIADAARPISDDRRFTFDPSGRRIPLFSKREQLSDWDEWRDPFEWELSAPIPCRLLGHAEYLITEAIIQSLVTSGTVFNASTINDFKKIYGIQFKNEESLRAVFMGFAGLSIINEFELRDILSLSIVHDCGKAALLPDETTSASTPFDSCSIIVETGPGLIVFNRDIVAADLVDSIPGLPRPLAIDAENGCFMFNDPGVIENVNASYHYGFSGDTGAGFYERPWIAEMAPLITKLGGGAIVAADITNDGIVRIGDSKTYGPVIDIAGIVNLVLQSSNKMRPYLRLVTDWQLETSIAVAEPILILDGLWIGSAGGIDTKLIIKGNYKCVTIRNCTIDPGNAGILNIRDENLRPVVLEIQGVIENLCIESSILGPIKLSGANSSVEELSISDSIVQSIDTAVHAIEINSGKTFLYRSTVFGRANLHWLYATDSLITGLTNVTNTQDGCFRFSAAPKLSRLPHPYESFLFETDSNHWFTSRQFGNPGFAQLSDTAPAQLQRGAENGSEIGAFSSLMNPIKFDGLKSKVEEYMPFGLIPIFINKT